MSALSRVTPHHVAAALLALGVVGGSLADTHPPTEPERRGDYLVLRADFHAHTRFSDGFLSPLELPLVARREGLQALAVTEHNLVFPSQLARSWSELVGGPIVLTGAEITTRRYHLIAVGIERTVAWDQPLAAVIADIHAQGGVAIAAHPARAFWDEYAPVMDELDGAEVMHPIAYRGESPNGWRWEDMVAFWRRANAAKGRPVAAIGSSDYHFFKALGTMHTYVFAKEATAEGVLDALRDGRTVVYDLDGNALSAHPELIELLRAEPFRDDLKPRAYAAEGALDPERLDACRGLLAQLREERAEPPPKRRR